MREMQGAEAKVEGSLHEVNDRNRMPKATPQITYFLFPLFLRCVKMREMQGAEDEPEGSLHEVNDQGRIPKATPQITYFHAPKQCPQEFASANPPASRISFRPAGCVLV